jgi:hypothetical protein
MRTLALLLALLISPGCVTTFDFDPKHPPEEATFPTKARRGPDVDPFLSTHLVIELEGVTREEAFDAFLGLPVKDYFTGTDDFSPVAKVEVLTKAWKPLGSRRRVTLEDDNTALETIFAKDWPNYFSFAIWNFTGTSGRFIGYVVAEWWFTTIKDGTRLEWRFNFRPRAWPSSWLLGSVVKEDYAAYMKQIAGQFKQTVEKAAKAKASANSTGK